MHNVRRTKPGTLSDDEVQRQREQERERLDTYRAVEGAFFAQRQQSAMTQDALDATTALLTFNPEYYTAWNYRREVLLHMFSESDSDAVRAQLLAADLELTQQALRRHPKVYWLWNHRRWCLLQLPSERTDGVPDKWRRELGLVEMMLEMDARNFMVWNYRRWIIAEIVKDRADSSDEMREPVNFPSSLSMDLPAAAKVAQLDIARREVQFATRKIEANFSNFSAWHYRSKLLPRIWDAEKLDDDGRRKFELVQQAMYTDPSDQSVWIYHRWLVAQAPTKATLDEQIAAIEELAELEPNCKWCVESLAHYKSMLLSRYADELDAAACEKLRSDKSSLLEQLMSIDSLRRARYEDLLRADS